MFVQPAFPSGPIFPPSMVFSVLASVNGAVTHMVMWILFTGKTQISWLHYMITIGDLEVHLCLSKFFMSLNILKLIFIEVYLFRMRVSTVIKMNQPSVYLSLFSC